MSIAPARPNKPVVVGDGSYVHPEDQEAKQDAALKHEEALKAEKKPVEVPKQPIEDPVIAPHSEVEDAKRNVPGVAEGDGGGGKSDPDSDHNPIADPSKKPSRLPKGDK